MNNVTAIVPRTGTVYMLEFADGRNYIGQTVNTLERRLRAHRSKRSSCREVRAALRSAPESCNALALMQGVRAENLDICEQLCIFLFETAYPSGRNLTHGGRFESQEMVGVSRERLREAARAAWKRPETRENHAIADADPAVSSRRSKAFSQVWSSEEYRERRRCTQQPVASQKGQRHSVKMSELWKDEAFKARMRAARARYFESPGAREKVGARVRAMWAAKRAADPEHALETARRSQAARNSARNPEHSEHRSAGLRKMWECPEEHARRSAAIKRAKAKPKLELAETGGAHGG